MRCADLALDRARREKRALAIYEEALKPAARDQLSLLGELRHAVEHDELRLFFQPKMELKQRPGDGRRGSAALAAPDAGPALRPWTSFRSRNKPASSAG